MLIFSRTQGFNLLIQFTAFLLSNSFYLCYLSPYVVFGLNDGSLAKCLSRGFYSFSFFYV